MLPQQYCLRWKYHHSNLQTMFSQLLDRGCFCDVTLACEGQLIRAHRVVLCACSTFFDTVLTNYASERDPIIIMKDVTFADIKCLIEFMYKGEINVEHVSIYRGICYYLNFYMFVNLITCILLTISGVTISLIYVVSKYSPKILMILRKKYWNFILNNFLEKIVTPEISETICKIDC